MSRHRRNHPGQRALICALWVGCGGALPEQPHAPVVSHETPIQKLYDDSGRPLAQSDDPVAAQKEAQRQAQREAPSSTAVTPRRVGRRDVRLHGARLDDALRALAVAGRFHLVVPEPLSQPIDLELVRVEPYDALVVLAEAHGLSVSYRRGIVIVGTPERAQP
ncbi:MAG TPA: hypothetical protein VFB62_05425 [Polyangiaceae bacterium]|nr:hypothetical protein [Polyangiaceae bacterium]